MNSLIVLCLILICGAEYSFSAFMGTNLSDILKTKVSKNEKSIDTISSSDNPSLSAVKQLNSILDNESYDKNVSPNLGENETLNVTVTMHIIYSKLDPEQKQLYIDLFFRQKWVDKRLYISENGEPVVGGQSLVDKVWIPDTFFPYGSSIRAVKYPTPNLFINIKPNGNILYSQRYQFINYCNQNETDSYVCTFRLESYGHTQKDIDYSWGKSADISDNFNKIGSYQMNHIVSDKRTINLSFGTYSALEVKLYFVKRLRLNSLNAIVESESSKESDD